MTSRTSVSNPLYVVSIIYGLSVCVCVCVRMCACVLRLKRILILVFEYSFGFETNSPNILLINKNN